MKKNKVVKTVAVIAFAIVGVIAMTSSPFKAEARNKLPSHLCILTGDANHIIVGCVGEGSSCSTVASCPLY